jgi:hypothetical protein
MPNTIATNSKSPHRSMTILPHNRGLLQPVLKA